MKLWPAARGISAQGVRLRSGTPQSLLGHEDGRKRGAVVRGEQGVSARRSVLWGESRGQGDSARVFGKHLQRFVTLRTPCAGAFCLRRLCFLPAGLQQGLSFPVLVEKDALNTSSSRKTRRAVGMPQGKQGINPLLGSERVKDDRVSTSSQS